MATYPILPSGSFSGQPIPIIATATPGTNVHVATASAGISSLDEVYLYAYNNHTANVNVVIEMGSYNVSHNIVVGIAPKSGLVPIIPGSRINNSKLISAFASTTNVVNIIPIINRRD